MDRIGDRLTLSEGAQYGKVVWCDSEGSYQTETESGTTDFYFHRDRVCGGVIYLRCEKWRT